MKGSEAKAHAIVPLSADQVRGEGRHESVSAKTRNVWPVDEIFSTKDI